MLTVPLPWTITGDTVYLGASGVPTSLAVGASGTVYIGGTIPAWSATPTLTGLILTEAVGSSALTLTGATQTASFPVITATQTWNASGTSFTGLKLNITNTASAAASLLLDLQTGGSTQLNVRRDGLMFGPVDTNFFSFASPRVNGLMITNNAVFAVTNSSSIAAILFNGANANYGLVLEASLPISWSPTSTTNLSTFQLGTDLFIRRDAANILAQRNGTTAQAFRVYNTFTDASNYERATLNWASNVLHLGAANAGTGTARVLQLDYGGTTTAAISVPITSGAIIVGGGIQLAGAVTQVNAIATSGLYGVPAIVATGRSTAQTGAVASLSTYTLPAVDGSFEVSGNVLVTASTTHSITMTVAYTDEGNTARTLTLNFSQVTGTLLTAITNVQGVGAYEGVPLHIRCKASTSITFATTGTFTSITYNAEGIIKQTA